MTWAVTVLLAVVLCGAGLASVLRDRGEPGCATVPTPASQGEAVRAAVGTQPRIGGDRVAVGGVADDGCAVHLGVAGADPGWVEVGGTVDLAEGVLTVLGVDEGTADGGTGGALVRLWYTPRP